MKLLLSKEYSKTTSKRIKHFILFVFIFSFVFATIDLQAQTESVKIKVYKEGLVPLGNIELQIDDLEPIKIPKEGVTYSELSILNLPPQSIQILGNKIETESWNYSRGVIEVFTRISTHQIFEGAIFVNKDEPLANVEVEIENYPNTKTTTDENGQFSIKVSKNIGLSKFTDIVIQKHEIEKIKFSRQKFSIQAKLFNPKDETSDLATEPKVIYKTVEVPVQNPINSNNKDSAQVKSIQRLDNIVNKIDLNTINDEETKALLQESITIMKTISVAPKDTIKQEDFLSQISDTSTVENDLIIFLDHARNEQKILERQRRDFTTKVNVINEKLVKNGGRISEEEGKQIIANIDELENILKENEELFKSNQDNYRNILSNIKQNLIDLSLLEKELTEQEKEFRKKIIYYTIALILLILLVLFFIWLARRFKKQGEELEKANTEIKHMNENLEVLVSERTHELQATNKELDTFLYRSSHDLRRPLTSIIGLSNIAKMVLEGEGQDLFDKATDTAKDMDRMLQKLIMVGNINHVVPEEAIVFEEIIASVLSTHKNLINEHQITFKSSIEVDSPLVSFKLAYEMIISCILENAFFYVSKSELKDKQVSLRIQLNQANELSMVVEDNGIGIPAENLEKVTDMYFIGDSYSQGNGLGLYVTKKAVQKLKGTLTVSSVEKERTVVSILI